MYPFPLFLAAFFASFNTFSAFSVKRSRNLIASYLSFYRLDDARVKRSFLLAR